MLAYCRDTRKEEEPRWRSWSCQRGWKSGRRALHQRALIFDACFSTPGFFKEEDTEIQAFLDGGIGGGLADRR